jgi:cysteine-S-conjugate beta-lyase
MSNGFEDLDLDRLRRRRSDKWRRYPPDVLPAFIAEMDYDLAEPVLAAWTGWPPRPTAPGRSSRPGDR